MKKARWTVAMIMILAMLMLSGCAGRDGVNDGTVKDGVVDDGMTNNGTNNGTYNGTNNGNHNGNGGILSDIADGVEDGINNIRDGMDTIEDDTRTDLGNGANGSQMNP